MSPTAAIVIVPSFERGCGVGGVSAFALEGVMFWALHEVENANNAAKNKLNGIVKKVRIFGP